MVIACMILLCNHKRKEFGKPHAYREPMCSSENCQWCGEPCFAGAAVGPPYVTWRRTKYKTLLN
jgi:hypothetical protein